MLGEVVAVNKANSDKRDDSDVLRAQDIVPPYNEKVHLKQESKKTETDKREDTLSQNQPRKSSEDIASPLAGKKAEGSGDEPAEAIDVENKEGGIPKFDLAKQILAEQRRVTAVRRKAPPKTGPVRGPKEKYSNGGGVRKAGVASPGKKTEPLLVQGQKVERDAITACVGTSLPAGRKAGLPLQKQGQKKNEMGAEPIGYTIKQPPPVPSEHEQIIAEIVARDIERLCGRLNA
jgi:hypothetical protein